MNAKRISTQAIILLVLAASVTVAQSRKENTNWIKDQLNRLTEQETTKPVFDFDACQMRMNVDTKEEGIRVRMDMNWPLSEIRRVSYKPSDGGRYTLVLDVPATKVKGKLRIGMFSKSLRQKGDGGHTSFDLDTQDETLVQEMQRRFESLIEQCRSGR